MHAAHSYTIYSIRTLNTNTHFAYYNYNCQCMAIRLLYTQHKCSICSLFMFGVVGTLVIQMKKHQMNNYKHSNRHCSYFDFHAYNRHFCQSTSWNRKYEKKEKPNGKFIQLVIYLCLFYYFFFSFRWYIPYLYSGERWNISHLNWMTN